MNVLDMDVQYTSSTPSISTYFTLLFSSACTDRRRGGTQLSVSSKVGGLEKGHPLSSEGVCHGVAPSFSWSSSRSPAGVLGVVWHFNTCLITRNTSVNSISFHFSALVSDVNNFSSFCVRGRKVPFTRSTGRYAY